MLQPRLPVSPSRHGSTWCRFVRQRPNQHIPVPVFCTGDGSLGFEDGVDAADSVGPEERISSRCGKQGIGGTYTSVDTSNSRWLMTSRVAMVDSSGMLCCEIAQGCSGVEVGDFMTEGFIL